MPPKTEFFHGEGCNFCAQTGYQDRIGVYEVLQVTDEMKSLIVANATHDQLKELAIEQGMLTLQDQALRLVERDVHHGRRDLAHDLRSLDGLRQTENGTVQVPGSRAGRHQAQGHHGGHRARSALRNELMSRQLEVKRISEKRGFNKIEITKQKVKRQEIMHFSRQIGAFVRAGIPIVDAIQTVREGTENERFRDVLQDVGEQIQSGDTFSEALARHGDVFPKYYIGILRSAEITGQLDVVLDQLSLLHRA